MRLIHIRIIGFTVLAIIFYVKNWTLLPYWAAMIVSLEILNSKETYQKQPLCQFYNLLFMSYLVLVVADRSRTFHLSDSIEWSFNSLMHILFALVVCFKISQYLTILGMKINNRMLYIALIFNMIGVLNEFMQNLMSNRAVFVLIPDARKDLLMNVVGTLVFIGVEYYVSKRKNLPQV